MEDQKKDNNQHGLEQGKDKEKKQVKIEVDNHPEHVAPETYIVSVFKALIKVSADKDLVQVINGDLTTLADTASITIEGGEVFFSHARHGGAS